MTPLRRLSITLAPFLVSGACAQLIGLSDYEKGEVTDGDAGDSGEGGESGAGGNRGGNGGSIATGGSRGGRGGSGTSGEAGMGGGNVGGEAGDAGEAGMGGESTGGKGAAGGRGGAGGMSGMSGMGGAAGSSGGGTGGSAGGANCTTVGVPLASANFDGDNSVWIPYSDGSPLPINVTGESLGIMADTAPNLAHLGGADYELYSGQFQRIMIPAGAVTMTLTGYRYVVTGEDTMSEDVFDDMAIQMWVDALDPAAGRVGEFAYFTHMQPTNGWTMFTGTAAVSAHAGQAVDLDMWAFTDSSVITHFYIDSLALTALVCQ